MDVLRDKIDQQLYIVDCNPTPAFGPPPGMSLKEQSYYLTIMAQTYQEMVSLN
jgi:hypothetical protein